MQTYSPYFQQMDQQKPELYNRNLLLILADDIIPSLPENFTVSDIMQKIEEKFDGKDPQLRRRVRDCMKTFEDTNKVTTKAQSKGWVNEKVYTKPPTPNVQS
jgi:hypothetical protein